MMTHACQESSYVEEVFSACRALGRARVVLRNAVGLTEAFLDLEQLELHDGWAHLCTDAVHVHLVLRAIAEVHIDAGTSYPGCVGPSVWFAARSGAPLLLITLDRQRGSVRHEQKRAFATLLATYGARRALVSADDMPPHAAMC